MTVDQNQVFVANENPRFEVASPRRLVEINLLNISAVNGCASILQHPMVHAVRLISANSCDQGLPTVEPEILAL